MTYSAIVELCTCHVKNMCIYDVMWDMYQDDHIMSPACNAFGTMFAKGGKMGLCCMSLLP